MGAGAGSIFISYRRGEDGGVAGRLYDRLERTFRRQRLFMDVDSIAPGQDFVSILEARMAECDVLLALIGRGWLTATDAAGRRRLDNPDDFVRIEIASGLMQGKRVIPVLIDDVPMPRAEELPDDLKPLVRRHAVPLSHERFKADAARLIRALKGRRSPTPKRPQRPHPALRATLSRLRARGITLSLWERVARTRRVREWRRSRRAAPTFMPRGRRLPSPLHNRFRLSPRPHPPASRALPLPGGEGIIALGLCNSGHG